MADSVGGHTLSTPGPWCWCIYPSLHWKSPKAMFWGRCHRRKSSLTLPTWLTRFIPAHSICVASSHVHTMTSTRLGLYGVQHRFRTLDPILCKAL